MEQSVPDQPIAHDIAADAEETRGPELVLFAVLVGGAKEPFRQGTDGDGANPCRTAVEALCAMSGLGGRDGSREGSSWVRRRQSQVFRTDDIAGADQQRM